MALRCRAARRQLCARREQHASFSAPQLLQHASLSAAQLLLPQQPRHTLPPQHAARGRVECRQGGGGAVLGGGAGTMSRDVSTFVRFLKEILEQSSQQQVLQVLQVLQPDPQRCLLVALKVLVAAS